MTGYIMAGFTVLALALGAVGYVKGRSDGRGSVERELVAAREAHERDLVAFNSRLNKLAGSIKRRCAAGEGLPECADLQQ